MIRHIYNKIPSRCNGLSAEAWQFKVHKIKTDYTSSLYRGNLCKEDCFISEADYKSINLLFENEPSAALMDFSIIIPTYNDWERLEKCLNELHPSVQGSVEYEIIVVDNAKTHSPPGWFINLPHVRLVHEPTPGSYVARNRGASLATGEFLAFTDADCIPEKDWLMNAFLFFKENHCDMIGGKVRIFREKQSSNWVYIYEKHVAFQQFINVPKNNSVTANFFVRRYTFEKLKGFDDGIKSGGDFEFTQRAAKNGYILEYAENVVVLHPARTTLRSLFKKQKRKAAWGYLNVRKSHGHSCFRILLSSLVHGLPGVIRNSKKPEVLNEKLIVFLIDAGLYVYKVSQQFLIFIRRVDPHLIRE